MKTRWIVLFLAAALGQPASALEFAPAERTARLEAKAVNDGSGLAICPSDPSLLWTLNDSGDRHEIYLVGADGTDRGVLRLKGGRNIDWEDIASFTIAGKSHVLIAGTRRSDRPQNRCGGSESSRRRTHSILRSIHRHGYRC